MSRTPDQLQNHFEHCALLHRANRLEEAAACYTALLAEAPQVAQIHYNLGLAQKTLQRHEAAAHSFRNATRLRPNWAEAFVNLANALQQTRQFAEAERCSRRALRLNPDLAEAYFIHGALLRDLGRYEAAIPPLREAVRRRPDLLSGHHNLGMALKDLGRLDEAEAAFHAALAIEPDNPVTQLNLGMLHLVAGRLAEGWDGLEYRWRIDGAPPRPLDTPLWDGRALQDGTLLLWAEQGLGDTLEFCRYVPLAAERARTVLVATPETHRLLKGLHPDVPVVDARDGVPEHAFQCPLPSLPRAFKTTLETVPGNTPYLRAEPAAAARWSDRLAPLPGLRVGLVWAGNATYMYDRFRSVPFTQFTRLLSQPGVSFVSLQKGPSTAELRAIPAGERVHDWTEELTDLADTAALIEGLDLVISVDTAVVHLTGALAKPVWLLNRFDTEWRWLLGRADSPFGHADSPFGHADSPWYPTLRQFRQPQPGDWQSVFTRVAAALADRVNKHA